MRVNTIIKNGVKHMSKNHRMFEVLHYVIRFIDTGNTNNDKNKITKRPIVGKRIWCW